MKRIEKNEDECGTRAKLGQRSCIFGIPPLEPRIVGSCSMALWRNEVKNGKDIRLMEYRERTYRSYSVFFKAYCLAMKFECDAVLRPSSCSSSWHFFFFFFFFCAKHVTVGRLFRNIHP